MKILIISFVDDNFGDNLIRICFESLLKVVLLNHGLTEADYSISRMNLKSIEKESVIHSDLIFFAGGGLFRLSYLNFFDYLKQIMEIAEERDIPVIFSSIGMNNMDADEEGEKTLEDFFEYSCIKAVAVRDHAELFKRYTKSRSFNIEEVCDPAVWTKHVYNIRPAADKKSRLIGINVVRGGLFKDNGRDWKLADELKFLKRLSELLDEAGFEYRFYTNGSILDNNALHYFVREYGIEEEKCIFPHTTREVVSAVSTFDAAVTFRMHSSIIAYSFFIPSVSLVWNDKIPFFYKKTGYPDRALDVDKWDAAYVFDLLKKSIDDRRKPQQTDEYSEYLMTVYRFLYRTLSDFLDKNSRNNIFDFDTVAACLEKYEPGIYEDLFDMRFKLGKAEKQYLARFLDIKEKDKSIKMYKKEQKEFETKVKKQKKEADILAAKNIQLKKQIEKEKEEYGKTIREQKKEIELLQKKFGVRVINFLKRKIKHQV